MTKLSRRQLLLRAGALGASPFALNLASMSRASAAGAADYKALVCIFMYGGNDSLNMVLPTDSSSWAAYQAARSAIALQPPGTAAVPGSTDFNAQLGGVLPITAANPQGHTFAVHPTMTGVRDLFAAGKLGVVANVGPLVSPTTKAQYATPSFVRPKKLFSHNDQQSTWQTFGPEGTQQGWGGLIADEGYAGNGSSMFTSVAVTSSPAVWQVGNAVRGYQMGGSGPIQVGTASLYGSSVTEAELLAIASGVRSTNLMEQDHAAVMQRSLQATNLLTGAIPAANGGPWGTVASGTDPLLVHKNPTTGTNETNPIAQQLQMVARTIAARSALGLSRQVFFVSADGFDTHSGQATSHALCMSRISHALAYFDATLAAMGVESNVTTFTASDFGRTFVSNSSGTDHGWGAHHLVMGGAVKGGDVYGTFPAYGLSDGKGGFTSPDMLGSGVLIPSTSVDQYAATMGKWMGVPDATLLNIMPNLNQFPAASRDLGFMAS